MDKKTLFLILLIAFVLPTLVLATDSTTGGVTITSMIAAFMTNVVWPIAAATVVVLWIITGILFLTAQGDPTKLNKAKLALIFAIAGTLIVVLAYSAINIVKESFAIPGPSGS